MLKCAPGVWRKRELYINEKSLIVFEKNKYYAENVASCPGLPYFPIFSVDVEFFFWDLTYFLRYVKLELDK